MEEKILSILLDMQVDMKDMKNEIKDIKKEQQEMKKEQQEMKKEQQEMKKEQQEMKKEQRSIKKEQRTMKEELQMTNQKIDNLAEEVRINKINISKILEVQNKTVEFLKSTLSKNEFEHKNFENRINNLERKVI